MEIWIPELPDIPLVQLFHWIPKNTTYWTNRPTAVNAYVNGAFWRPSLFVNAVLSVGRPGRR